MNSNIIPANPNQSQPRIVRRELNFDFGQFFYPNEKQKIFETRYFESVITDEEGNTQTIKAIVNPVATLGTLTTYDERIFYALIEVWEENNRASKVLFSEREIARRLNIQWGRYTAKAITQSLNRLRIVGIEWEGSFYDKSTDRFTEIKNPFTILSHLKSTSTKDKAFKAQIAEFSFDERVIENLNSNHSRPVRFDVVLSFNSPLAQAVYNLLDRKLYGTKEYHRTTEGLLLEDLSLIAKSYSRKGIRHQEIKGVIKQLINKPLAFGEVIEAIEIDPKRDVIKVKRSGSAAVTPPKVTPTKLIERVVTPKPVEPEAVKPLRTPTKTEQVEKPPVNKTPLEAEEAIALFKETFLSATDITNKSSLEFANSLVTSLGLDSVKKLISYAYQEAQKTKYEPQHFIGLQQYVKPYKELQKEEQARANRYAKQEEKLKLQREQDRKDRHEGKYTEDYHAYIDSLLIALEDNDPDKLENFSKWQDKKREEWLEKCGVNKTNRINFRKISLSAFQKQGALVLRLIEYFKDDLDYKFLTFWEWDKEINPNSYPY